MEKLEFIDNNKSIDEIIPKINGLNDKVASTSKVLIETKTHDNLCRVCEDISTGRHYGQYTCEGCKSFFKRSIRRKTDYVCKNNGKCKIYLELRNQCPACRFTKCQHVGMKKDAVQSKRISNSRSPIRKDLPFCKFETENKQSDEENSSNDWDSDFITTTNLSIKLVLNSVLQAENSAPIHHSDNIIDQSMRIVYAIGEWSKKLLYSDKIQAPDKLLLLHNSWCQLFILNYSLCGLANKLLYRGNSSNTSFYAIQSQLLAITRIPLDAIEIGCLKAIIFFNPDTYLLFNCSLIDKAQETFQEALEQHIKHTYTDTNRFGKILLRIPYMKEITVRQIMEVFFNDNSDENGNIIYDLFQRILNTSIKSPDNMNPLTDI